MAMQILNDQTLTITNVKKKSEHRKHPKKSP